MRKMTEKTMRTSDAGWYSCDVICTSKKHANSNQHDTFWSLTGWTWQAVLDSAKADYQAHRSHRPAANEKSYRVDLYENGQLYYRSVIS